MRLTQFTDYGLRLLIYLGHCEGRGTVEDAAAGLLVSRNHLVKVAHRLVGLGLIRSYKGRGGGLELACDPADVRLGVLVRDLEPDFHLVECFDREHNTCPLIGACDLEQALYKARDAFFKELDTWTLRHLLVSSKRSAKMVRLGISPKK